jgi:hypothetical protein
MTASAARAASFGNPDEPAARRNQWCGSGLVGPSPGRIINYTQGADDMSDHCEWTSYSHWRMFPTGTKSSR